MTTTKLKSLLNDSPLLTGAVDSKPPISIDQLVQNNPALKAIGLYFSAHWCGPCRQFTPQLKKFYNEFNQNEKKFEIVLVSSDSDEKMFKEYYGEMPWLAIPFSEETETLRAKLKKDFKIPGIPSLVILTPEGKMITDSGRDCILSDPKGEEFPWHIQPFWEILTKGEKLNSHNGLVDVEELKSKKVIGIYFSAHWCPPCRKFTPVLTQAYNNVNNGGEKSFEIIFVSADHDVESYNEYFKEMPWVALPFSDPRIPYLKRRYKVKGYPRLCLVDNLGNTVCNDGRSRVELDVQGKEFPWCPKNLDDINTVGNLILNEETVLISIDPNLKEEQINMLNTVSTKYVQKWKSLEEQPLYFLYGISGNMFQRLQSFLKLTNNFPALVILNVQSQSNYILSNTQITEENVSKLVEDFISQKIQLVPLSK